MFDQEFITRALGTFIIGFGCGMTFRSGFPRFLAMAIGGLLWNYLITNSIH